LFGNFFLSSFLSFFIKLEFQVNLQPGVVNCVEYASFEVLTLVLMEIRICWGKMAIYTALYPTKTGAFIVLSHDDIKN
jgi:hypothetical protein